ncbi:MAG: glycosyltransferase family A protein [Desulfomicrobium sp.]|nr:glycosyltransferase family A protein [Desulfomicrobium sp.]
MKITISVIIPTHNRPELLKRALQSVLKQTLTPYEVIVVDDVGCTKTKTIVESMNSHLVMYVHNIAGIGAASSRNLGIEYSSGDYVAFLDDDDEFKTNKIEVLTREIKSNPDFDVFYHPAHINMVNEGISYYSKPYIFKENDDIFRALLTQNFIGGTPMVVVRKQSLIDAKLFDEQLPALEDYDLWLKLAKNKCYFKYINSALTNYYYTTKTKSISKDLKKHTQALNKIENKYYNERFNLSKKEKKIYNEWRYRMNIHKALLNGQYFTALKYQLRLCLYSPTIKNIFSLLVVMLGPKLVFKLKSKIG